MQTESPLWPFGNREIAWHFSNRGCLFDIFHQPLFQAYQDAQVLDTQNCCSLPFIFNGYWFVFRGKKQGIFKKSDFLHSGSHHVDLWAAVLQPSRNTCSCVKNSPWVKVWLTAVWCVRLKLLKKMEKKKVNLLQWWRSESWTAAKTKCMFDGGVGPPPHCGCAPLCWWKLVIVCLCVSATERASLVFQPGSAHRPRRQP